VGTNGSVIGNVMQGNIIGLDSAGINGLPNGKAGVGITSASGNQIGGLVSGARNVISANGDAGISWSAAEIRAIRCREITSHGFVRHAGARQFFSGIYMQQAGAKF